MENEKQIMDVLVIEPGMEPVIRNIPTGLASLQTQVDGMIEVVYPFTDPVCLIMNEEGKLKGLEWNRALYDEKGQIYDVIAGTFLVAGLTEDSFGSLTPEQIQKYTDLYRQPQKFLKMGRDIVVIPIEPKKQVGTFELFQLKEVSENQELQFTSYDRLKKSGHTVRKRRYHRVYSGTLYQGETLDSIYERFNLHHPGDFRGHSLSVSDVIVLHQDNQEKAYYVDAFGFQQVPEFFADNPLKKVEELLEDDYGMIDGIINNGDRRRDDEEKKQSVMDRIQEKKKEAVDAGRNSPKPRSNEKRQEAELN